MNWIYTEPKREIKGRQEMIISNQNLSLQLSRRENGNTYFLVFIVKRHCLFIITTLCSLPNAQIKIKNLLQILLTFTVQIYVSKMPDLMLFRTVVLRAI